MTKTLVYNQGDCLPGITHTPSTYASSSSDISRDMHGHNNNELSVLPSIFPFDSYLHYDCDRVLFQALFRKIALGGFPFRYGTRG